MQQQQEQTSGIGQCFNLFYGLVSAHALTITPFIRTGFGREALRLPGVVALVLIVAWAKFSGDQCMWNYLACWLFAVACQRMRTSKLVRQGWRVHSRYNGWPKLAMWVPFVRKESTAKRFVEPVLCLVVGFGLGCVAEAHRTSSVLAGFISLGFISLSLVERIGREVQRKRLQAMQDAQIEQQHLAERFRGQWDE